MASIREPFAMTFPIETTEDAQVQARVIEATPGPATSDRAEVRCVVGLHVVKHGVRPLDAVIDVAQQPAARQERRASNDPEGAKALCLAGARGIPLGDGRRRAGLRVAEEELHPAGNPRNSGAIDAGATGKNDPAERARKRTSSIL